MQRPGPIVAAKYAVAVKVAILKRQVHRHARASDTHYIGMASIGEAALCNEFVMPGPSSLPCADCLNLLAMPCPSGV
jgi:hypothetical protein